MKILSVASLGDLTQLRRGLVDLEIGKKKLLKTKTHKEKRVTKETSKKKISVQQKKKKKKKQCIQNYEKIANSLMMCYWNP